MSLCNHLIFALFKPNQVALVSAAALHLSQPGVEPAAGAGGSGDSGMAGVGVIYNIGSHALRSFSGMVFTRGV